MGGAHHLVLPRLTVRTVFCLLLGDVAGCPHTFTLNSPLTYRLFFLNLSPSSFFRGTPLCLPQVGVVTFWRMVAQAGSLAAKHGHLCRLYGRRCLLAVHKRRAQDGKLIPTFAHMGRFSSCDFSKKLTFSYLPPPCKVAYYPKAPPARVSDHEEH